jgi:hypothetical protein
MRSSWFTLWSLAISLMLGCSDDGVASSATGVTSTDPTADGGGTTGDGDASDTTGDGDGVCVHQCTSDADCLRDGMDVNRTCVDGACTREPCTSDEACVALSSGWTTPCTSGGECPGPDDVCIDWGGEGLCATQPSRFHGCSERLGAPGNPIEVPDINGNLVIVCGQPDAICTEDAQCFTPCDHDLDCDSDAYPVCDVESGQCACSSDADCATLENPHQSVCIAGVCGCSDDQQCVDGNAGDVCTTDGSCGCSGDMACAGIENPFDGGMVVCEAL